MDGSGWIPIEGFCPFGCGETLRAEWNIVGRAEIVCVGPFCQDRHGVTRLLKEDETEHIAHCHEEAFTIQHPLKERLDGTLFDCKLHQSMRDELGPPGGREGVYRVSLNTVSGDRYGELLYERVGDLPGWSKEEE